MSATAANMQYLSQRASTQWQENNPRDYCDMGQWQ